MKLKLSPYSILHTLYSIPYTLYPILYTAYSILLLVPILYTLYPIPYTIFAPPARAATPSATATVPSLSVTGDTDAPSIPILLRPLDGTVTGDPRPELVWHESTDVGSNTVIYTLYLDNVATYLGISSLGNSAGVGYTSRLEDGDLRLLPNSGLPDGIYSWYVVASDLSNNSARSTTWHFTVDTTPPPLTLVDLDNYHLPDLSNGPNFEIAGPKDIYFTVLSDPFINIQITLTPLYSIPYTPYTIQTSTSSTGLATLYTHLEPGLYTVTALAIDRGGNTTLLPDFTLTITQAQITVPLPPLPGLPPSYSIPYTPYSLSSLPATISQVLTRSQLLPYLVTLLALAMILLLIILKRRRFNLILLDSALRPIDHATIYHSNPSTDPHTLYSILHTPYHKLYLPHLSRYSTLTIRVNPAGAADQRLDSRTYILSISVNARLYTIVLG